jgi:hypothetical protein
MKIAGVGLKRLTIAGNQVKQVMAVVLMKSM